MKKLFAVTLTLLLLIGCVGPAALAETDAQPAEVFVTVADATGSLALAQEKITVTDRDSDGKLTLDEALYAAHEAKYEGGAAAGYASSVGDYGLSLDKLWGTANGGGYGYYVNHVAALNLSDEVKAGDYIDAFVYTDLTAYSDKYCWFDADTVSAEAGKEITLILSGAGYDAAWNPVTLPVSGAQITVDGQATGVLTDSEGKAVIQIADGGSHLISAVSATELLVPPVCTATVTAQGGTPSGSGVPAAPADGDGDKASAAVSPKTADGFRFIFFTALMTASLGIFLTLCAMRKKPHEK